MQFKEDKLEIKKKNTLHNTFDTILPSLDCKNVSFNDKSSFSDENLYIHKKEVLKTNGKQN